MAQILTATRKGNGTRIVPENKDEKWIIEWERREKVQVHETAAQRWIRKLTKQPRPSCLTWVRKEQLLYFSREEIFSAVETHSNVWKLKLSIMAGDGLEVRNVRFAPAEPKAQKPPAKENGRLQWNL